MLYSSMRRIKQRVSSALHPAPSSDSNDVNGDDDDDEEIKSEDRDLGSNVVARMVLLLFESMFLGASVFAIFVVLLLMLLQLKLTLLSSLMLLMMLLL